MPSGATLASKPATAGAGEPKPTGGRVRAAADPSQPLLDVRGVTIQYKTQAHLVTATYRVGFNVLQGDRFVLLGPSGCGKSTLLKAVGGYLQPTEGEIRLKGELITKPGPGPHHGVPGIRSIAAVENGFRKRRLSAQDDGNA